MPSRLGTTPSYGTSFLAGNSRDGYFATAASSRRQAGSDDGDPDAPSVDERLQQAAMESLHRFQTCMGELDRKLLGFSNAVRQLGSSVGILSSALRLRERLTQLAWLFHENAAALFPLCVPHQPKEALVAPHGGLPRRKRARAKTPFHFHRPLVYRNLGLEDFPEQFGLLARDVVAFLSRLNEFPEFTDEALNGSIIAFEGDLKYWSSCLKVYRGQFGYPSVQRYLHDLLSEISGHIEAINSSLSTFVDIGVPTIRFAQSHGTTNLLNLTTIATFFSAVTATTLQFSFGSHDNMLENAVNGFWFTSMVFSIAAAVNSLLGLTWRQAMYRSPSHRVPWWILIWIKRSPLVFLVLSIMCFSVGLVLFAYSSQQSSVVSAVTTIFTAFSSFGLVVVSTWFALERLTFSRHKGEKWLEDSLDDLWDAVASLPPFQQVDELSSSVAQWLLSASKRVYTAAKDVCASALALLPHRRTPETLLFPSPPPTPPMPTGSRFALAVRTVMMARSGAETHVPRLGRWTSSPQPEPDEDHRGESQGSSRVAELVPKLNVLAPVQELAVHQKLVRHLQFSPDGRFLATASWDRTSVIFDTETSFEHHKVLHLSGSCSQVAWSPDGSLILTKLLRSIKIWTQAGILLKNVERHRLVQSLCWSPDGQAFMSVEGNEVTKLDLAGQALDTYSFDHLEIHDVGVTSDSQRLVGVGTLTSSIDGLVPSKSRTEKQIVVYNLDRKAVESRVPILHDIRDITLARTGDLALVSYESETSPQLWKLDMWRSRAANAPSTARLRLLQTYMPDSPADFVGVSYFGGKDDELVLCASKSGDIHIWHRNSGALLHHVHAQSLGGGDLTCVAWNSSATEPFMLATGYHDGTVRVWAGPPELARSTHSDSGSLSTPSRWAPTYLHPDVDLHTESPVVPQAESAETPRRGRATLHIESREGDDISGGRRATAFPAAARASDTSLPPAPS
ncbi:WD40-repeat-containing domain protein [Gloeopeniophorella convolvens]|nr:WD40-repeat-containing domain protein [Gloeopeniophorella convolvens]